MWLVSGIEIDRYWNGMSNKGEKATMAVKTDEAMKYCVWTIGRSEYRWAVEHEIYRTIFKIKINKHSSYKPGSCLSPKGLLINSGFLLIRFFFINSTEVDRRVFWLIRGGLWLIQRVSVQYISYSRGEHFPALRSIEMRAIFSKEHFSSHEIVRMIVTVTMRWWLRKEENSAGWQYLMWIEMTMTRMIGR